MEKLYLHAVIIDKKLGLTDAKKSARKIMEKSIGYYRMTDDSYRFRNIPASYFKSDSFRSKKINENVTLIFGHLKEKYLKEQNEEAGHDSGASTASESSKDR